MKVKNIAKTIVFCMIFLFLLNRIYAIFSWKDTAGDYTSSMEVFYGLEENVVDVLFLGSSHSYCSTIPAQLWEDYGMASFSMAISGQDLVSSYYSFVEALETQDLKVVCVDLFGCVLQGYQDEGNLYRNLLPRKLSMTSVEAVNSMVETDNKADFLLKWPIIHTRYKELKKQDFVAMNPVYLGYTAEFVAEGAAKLDFGEVTPKPIDEKEQEFLIKMIGLAQESGTELVFVLAPYQIPLFEQEMIAYAKEIIAEYNVPVLDLEEISEEIGLDWKEDMIDYGHTNHWGAQKVTAYLGEYLNKHYELPDHRGDNRYAMWELDLKARKHEEINYYLTKVCDMQTYFEELSRLEDYTIVISTNGEYISETADMVDCLQMLGGFHEYYDGNNVWVFENGENIYTANGNGALKTLPLTYGELFVIVSEQGTNVLVDSVACQISTDGVNVIVYDNILGSVVDSVGFEAMNAYRMIR